MAFDFPNTPTTNQIATMPDGTVRRWDGTKWVAGQSPTGPYCFIGDTPPSSPTPGVTWWDSISCQLFVYYNDGNSSQWVPAVAVPASIGEAPSNSNFYARQNGQWANIGSSQLQGNIGRNLLHNSLFNIAQRGAGPFAVNSYTADRWLFLASTTGGSVIATIGTMSASTAAIFSDEYAKYNFQVTTTAGSGAGDATQLQQSLEDVRRLSGKTVTISFWAWTSSGTPKIGVELAQVFGSGGSPSAFVSIPVGAITINTTPARYSVTVALPSVSGKTFGTTSGSDYTALVFWLSSGSTNAARASNIGFQSGTFLLWGVQLEIGTIATQLEKIDLQQDLAKCQRFYSVQNAQVGGYCSAGTISPCGNAVPFPVTMRATPTLALSGQAYGNASALVANAISNNSYALQLTIGTTGLFSATATLAASADL